MARGFGPYGLAVDKSGNVFAANSNNSTVKKLDYSDPPSLIFPTATQAGTTDTTDGPLSVTVQNDGNATLMAIAPGLTASADFAQVAGSGNPPDCTAGFSLSAGTSCNLTIEFAPMAAGTLSESFILTDNSLNASAATQNIQLGGTGEAIGTTTTLASSLSPSSYGQLVTITAVVTQASGTLVPGGTVQFSVDGIPAGAPVSLSSGAAAYTTSVLTAGTHSITAVYSPASGSAFTGSSSAPLSQAVKQAVPAITWSTPAAIPYGTALGATQLDASSPVAGTFTYSPANGTLLSVGSHTLSVTFLPTDPIDYSSATSSISLTVTKATPVISWSAPSTITYGTPLSSTQLDATSTLTGSFTYSPVAGTVLSAGSHTLTVRFSPSNTTDYTTATVSVTLTVSQATTTLDLVASNSSPTLGTAITLTATASSNAGTPAGSVTFYSGTTSLGKGTLSGGVATLSTSALTVGLQSVTAVYPGSTDFAATTSNAVSVTVGQATPTLTLSVSSASSALGSKFTFTALLSGTLTGTTPTGSVSFIVDGTLVATSTVASSKATYAITPAAGSHTITATYSGDANYVSATANVVTVTIAKATPAIKLTSSSLTVKPGVLVTFTAKLSNTQTSFPATGSVEFFDGATQIGSGSLSSGIATFASSTLSVGAHAITAVYPGDSNYNSVTSSELQETVN